MFSVTPVVNTVPAMPACEGMRISPDIEPGGVARPQLVGLAVIDEEAGALGVEQVGSGRHDPLDQDVQVQFAGQAPDHLKKPDFLAHTADHVVEAAEQVGVLVGRGDVQVEIEIAALDAAHRGEKRAGQARCLGRGEDHHSKGQNQAYRRDAKDPEPEGQDLRKARSCGTGPQQLMHLEAGRYPEEHQRQPGNADGQVKQLAAQPD